MTSDGYSGGLGPTTPKEDPEAIFQRLAAEARAASKPSRTRSLLIGFSVVFVAIVVGLIVSTLYLEHLATRAVFNAPQTVAVSTLNSAVSAVNEFASADTVPVLTADPERFGVDLPKTISIGTASSSDTEVAIGSPNAAAVVVTAEQLAPAVCLGVLRVFSSATSPVFSDYPETSNAGTYYFEAPLAGGSCDPASVRPLAGDYLSSSGFPTTAVP